MSQPAAQTSSQAFVRALKSPSDPPQPGGPQKILIATDAWNNPSFHVPSKDQVIADWILSSIAKDKPSKDKPFKSNTTPLLDPRYWTLLADIVSPLDSSSSRPIKTWLTTLLNRTSISTTVISFLDALRQIHLESQQELTLAVRRCLTVMWPMTAYRLTPDTTLDCFVAAVRVYELCTKDENLAQIAILITSSYRTSIANASSKKKLHVALIQTHLQIWMEAVSSPCNISSIYENLLTDIYAAGIETLFSLDVLRQIHEPKLDSSIFEALHKIVTTSLEGKSLVLGILPRLFESYIQSVKKHRGTLFSQGSGSHAGGAPSEEWRGSSMKFFASCQDLLSVSEVEGQSNEHEQDWFARVALLTLVDRENLFNAISQQPEVAYLLNHIGELAITALSFFSAPIITITKYAIDCISAIARIDYDLIAPSLPRIMPKLLLVTDSQQSSTSALVFLNLLLDYHIKTRSIHSYITSLLHALSVLPPPSLDSRTLYRTSSLSPLLHQTHLDRLSKSIRSGFLVSSQTVPVVRRVSEALQQAWDAFSTNEERDGEGEGEEPQKKKRKTEEPTNPPNPNPHRSFHAISFSTSARVASVVLSSLPSHSHSHSDDVRLLIEELRSRMSIVCNKMLKANKKLLLKKKKNKLSSESEDGWEGQVIASACLRLQYALSITSTSTVTGEAAYDGKTLERVVESVAYTSDEQNDESMLVLEVFRTLLHSSAQGALGETEIRTQVIDPILTYLELNFLPTSSVTWSGGSCLSSSGDERERKGECALAILHMMLGRWLSVIDALASEEQLTRFSEILLKIPIHVDAEESAIAISTMGLQATTLWIQTLRSADLWELPNLRNALLSSVDKNTKSLEELSENEKKSKKIGSNSKHFRRAISTYEVLLFCPLEYITRSSRAEFVKRALDADQLIGIGSSTQQAMDNVCRPLTVLRTFLKLVFVHMGTVEQPVRAICESVERIIKPKISLGEVSSEYTSTTLDLFELYTASLLKSSAKDSSSAISQILKSFVQHDAFSLSSTSDGFRGQVLEQSLIRLLELLARDFSSANFSDDTLASMRSLYDYLLARFLPHVAAFDVDAKSTSAILDKINLLTGWSQTLSFGRWLRIDGSNAVHRFGQSLVSSIVQTSSQSTFSSDHRVGDVGVLAFSILLEERYSVALPDALLHLDLSVAAYIVLCRISESDARSRLDAQVSRACKAMSVSEFSHILDLVAESLSNTDLSPKDLASLCDLSITLLGQAPQGTLKCIQIFTTRCVNLFPSRSIFTKGPAYLSLQVLNVLDRHCSDRPAALRLVDLGSIWSILSKFLAHSEDHDEETSRAIFDHVVGITSALIRLRRDLVALTLPHLGMILRQLIMSIRSLRPQLGGKQRTLVTDTLPKWINANHPLGPDEAKGLARLLATLTTKTVVRSYASSTEIQKQESLAKPFSKHAAYVLKSYIEAMNDPLCVLPAEVRKELQPGLFCLCDVLNDHSRDAMMVSALDAGGKTTMKTLWKEYEKQKYIGKG